MFDRRANFNSLPIVLTCALALPPIGCGGSGAGTASEATMPVPAAATSEMRAANDVAGQYAGTVSDDVLGGGQIAAEISQYHNAAGGILTLTFGSAAYVTPVSFLVSGERLTGTGNFSVSGSSGVCTFSETATHRFGRHLDGIYRAVHGCSGENGTFRMNEKCQYLQRSGTAADVGLKPC